MVEYGVVQNDEDLMQILDLQKENHRSLITEEEFRQEGFVTVRHDLALLQRMNHPHPHIIAKTDGKVIAYALVMLPDHFPDVPALGTLVKKLQQCTWNDRPITNIDFFIMGQICINKGFRGIGVFPGLYQEMKQRMHPYYNVLVTEISHLNQRSIRAHQKVGFELLLSHATENGEQWDIVILDLTG